MSLNTVFHKGALVTTCCECGKVLIDANEWSECLKRHVIERLNSTPQGREIYEMMRPSYIPNNR